MKTTIILIFVLLCGQLLLGQTATAPSAGDGSEGSPYQIASLENLYWIAASDAVVPSPTQATRWAVYYVQTSDIDASTTSGWFSGQGWESIGNATIQFSGSYNGQGHAIDSLFIARASADLVGLFGQTNHSKIDSIGVTNVNITGGGHTAGLVGESYDNSTISSSYSTGTVSGSSYVGGLVGENWSSTVSNSYSNGTISGSGLFVGGLVGGNRGATVSNSYSTGNVSSSMSRVGGLVGYNTNSTVTNSYSTGTASGSDYVGGLVGLSSSSTVNNSFWDTETSGLSSSSGGTGKTTAEMKTQSTFLDAGWSSSIWNIGDGINDGYPYLDWQNLSGTPLPVELSMLNAKCKMNSIELKWKTATEMNNYGFEIERRKVNSYQLSVISDQWLKVGFVEGAGTSNSPKEYSFSDEKLTAGRYKFRLKQIDLNGLFKYSQSVEVEVEVDNVPKEFALYQNYPNPFNPTTTIRFDIPFQSSVRLEIFNILGQRVEVLTNSVREAGSHEINWNAKVASGVYFYKLTSGNFSAIRKFVLMK